MHEIKKILLDNGQLICPVPIDPVDLPELNERPVSMDVLRLDMIHPVISGNKWFKLKGWLQIASSMPAKHIVTFGGAWSNHIIAAAYAAQAAGLRATGIIRGEQPARLSETLQAAKEYGMQLEFISRNEYGQRHTTAFVEKMLHLYPGACIIPEGGAGTPGIEGSRDILQTLDSAPYTHILCAIGTGTMFQGLSQAAAPGQTVLGIAVLKGLDQPAPAPIQTHTHASYPHPTRHILHTYHFGGYARHTPQLLDFMNSFYHSTGIPSDFVYTGKLFFAALDLARNDLFPPGSHILLIHSGGLAGNISIPPGKLHF